MYNEGYPRNLAIMENVCFFCWKKKKGVEAAGFVVGKCLMLRHLLLLLRNLWP
jgi:hypothetical protein